MMPDPRTRTTLWVVSGTMRGRYQPNDTWNSCSFHWSIEGARGQAEYFRSLNAENVVIRKFILVGKQPDLSTTTEPAE